MQYYIDLHATVDADISVREGHEISHRLKDKLKAELPNIADILIHIEPTGHY
jgi:divalent metal cation (Fe/Co/Zn/Cd) transporter